LSHHPNSEVRPRKLYIPPAFRKLYPAQNPAPSLIEKVRSSLKELESMLRADPNDSVAADLQRALRHMLDELEPKQQPIAAD
jgi:hypothetical protein